MDTNDCYIIFSGFAGIMLTCSARNLLRKPASPHPVAPKAQECINVKDLAYIWRDDEKAKKPESQTKEGE
jgi:hypothetical protein